MTYRARHRTWRVSTRGVLSAAVVAAALATSAPPGWSQGIQVAPGAQGRLQADRVRYDVRTQVLTAEGNVRLTLGDLELRAGSLRLEQKTLIALAEGAVSVRRPGLTLEGARVRYEIRRQVAQAEGPAVLIQGDVTVRAARMTIDLERQTIDASGGVTAVQGANTLTGQTLRADLKAKRAEVSGDGQLVRATTRTTPSGEQTPQETAIRGARLRIRWDALEVQADGGVSVRQNGRTARAQHARYADAEERLDLSGGVVVEQFGDPAAEGATLTAERLTVLLREGDMQASGGVTVTQKGRRATGDRALYSEKTKRITLTGRVQMQDEEGNLIKADTVIIDLEAETFDASGNVETIFKVKRGK